VTRTIVANPLVVTEWIFTGTQAGLLGPPIFENNVPPTGKTIRFRGVSIYELNLGQIKCLQMYLDMATVLVELGTTL
jgi:predicted ester cyclase